MLKIINLFSVVSLDSNIGVELGTFSEGKMSVEFEISSEVVSLDSNTSVELEPSSDGKTSVEFELTSEGKTSVEIESVSDVIIEGFVLYVISVSDEFGKDNVEVDSTVFVSFVVKVCTDIFLIG